MWDYCRKIHDYIICIGQIFTVCRFTQQTPSPHHIVCDCELSLITAIKAEFPTARVCGCVFPFCISLYHKIQNLGLERPYRHDVRLRAILQQYISMCCLPLAIVQQNFLQIYGSWTVNRLICCWPQLRDFILYVRLTNSEGRIIITIIWYLNKVES